MVSQTILKEKYNHDTIDKLSYHQIVLNVEHCVQTDWWEK